MHNNHFTQYDGPPHARRPTGVLIGYHYQLTSSPAYPSSIFAFFILLGVIGPARVLSMLPYFWFSFGNGYTFRTPSRSHISLTPHHDISSTSSSTFTRATLTTPVFPFLHSSFSLHSGSHCVITIGPITAFVSASHYLFSSRHLIEWLVSKGIYD
jgi:hypothetical protein